MTPLMEAVNKQSFTITKLLVDAGANVYLRVPPDNKNVIDKLDDLLELTWIHNDMRNKLTRIKNYLLKANHSAHVIQGNFKKYITKKKLDSANVIKRNYLEYSYAPGGPGYNRAKKHFETAFGKKRKTRKVRKLKKLPKALIRMAKKYKVKVTIKRGGKRIYKSIILIKKQIRQKKNKMKK